MQECAFNGSGYERILEDKDYAHINPTQNKVMYSQLAVATEAGNAYHLVKKHEPKRDDNAAWVELCNGFDGDHVKDQNANDKRFIVENLKLYSGGSASEYVSSFLTAMNDLNRIPEEGFSPGHVISLFLKNIEDEAYESTVTFLRNSSACINTCVTAIRRQERILLSQKSDQQKLKQKIRRMGGGKSTSSDGFRKCDEFDIVSTDPNTGFGVTKDGILVAPKETWYSLDQAGKNYITSLNRAQGGNFVTRFVVQVTLMLTKFLHLSPT